MNELKNIPGNNLVNNKNLKKNVTKNITKSVDPSKMVKPSVGKRLKRLIVSSDGKSVKEYLVKDVIIPATKDLVSGIINKGTNMILYGNANRGPSNGNMRGSIINSGKRLINFSGMSSYSFNREPVRTNGFDLSTLIFEDHESAEKLLYDMKMYLEEYDCISVADLCEMIDRVDLSSYTDNKYGWVNLNSAHVEIVKDGYFLALPKPKPIN